MAKDVKWQSARMCMTMAKLALALLAVGSDTAKLRKGLSTCVTLLWNTMASNLQAHAA